MGLGQGEYDVSETREGRRPEARGGVPAGRGGETVYGGPADLAALLDASDAVVERGRVRVEQRVEKAEGSLARG